VWIKNVQVHPDRMLVDVGNATGNSQNVTIQGEKPAKVANRICIRQQFQSRI